MTDATATHTRRGRRAIERVERVLASELQSDEQIEAAPYVQRWIPFLQLFMFFGPLGETLHLLIAKPYVVAASSSRLFVLSAGRFRQTPKRKLFDAPLGEMRIERLRRGPFRRAFQLSRLGGADQRFSAHRSYWRELERLESLVRS